jgi:multicomponent Na+:H+ antiporter subunit E
MKRAVEPGLAGRTAGRVNPGAVAVLFGLWVLLSGKLDVFHLGMGVLAVAFAVWQGRGLAPMQLPGEPALRIWRMVPYTFWLFGQMILSALHVAQVVIRPRDHLDPQLIQFRSQQPSLLAEVILANSITLTPGTLTIDLQENRLIVHALTARTAREVLEGGMARRVGRLFSDEPLRPIEVITPPAEGSEP